MTRTGGERVQKASSAKAANVPAFKYYIHDTAEGYVFEFCGPFSEKSVAEVTSCWQTAQSTLKDRKLVLNLVGVSSLDAGAKQWLALMAQEGARCIPESFLLEAEAGLPGRDDNECQLQGTLSRLSNAIRGQRKPVTQEL